MKVNDFVFVYGSYHREPVNGDRCKVVEVKDGINDGEVTIQVHVRGELKLWFHTVPHSRGGAFVCNIATLCPLIALKEEA